MSGDRILFGSQLQLSGFGGNACVWRREGGTWVFEDDVTPPGIEGNNRDEYADGFSIDGDYLVVHGYILAYGTRQQVFVWRRSGSDWLLQHIILPDELGPNALISPTDVLIHGDFVAFTVYGSQAKCGGNTDCRSVAVLMRDDQGTPVDPSDDTWAVVDELQPAGVPTAPIRPELAFSGDDLFVGNYDDRTVFVFRRNGTHWEEIQTLRPGDWATGGGEYFGWPIVATAEQVLIGAHGDGPSCTGAAYLFSRSGTSWGEPVKITKSGRPGYSCFMPSHFFPFSAAIAGNEVLIGVYGQDVDPFNANVGAVFRFRGSDTVPGDSDGDGVGDSCDNCPTVASTLYVIMPQSAVRPGQQATPNAIKAMPNTRATGMATPDSS